MQQNEVKYNTISVGAEVMQLQVDVMPVEHVIELANLAWILPRWAEAFHLYKSVESRTTGDRLGHVAYRLGLLYKRGYGNTTTATTGDVAMVEKYMKIALDIVPKCAIEGDCEALCDLGHMYENGNGLDHDEKIAVDYYRQAAELGFPRGQYNLAVMLQSGAESKKTALQYYKLAADADYPCAQYNLACMFYRDGDYKNAIRFYAKAADWGDIDAQKQVEKMFSFKQQPQHPTTLLQLVSFLSEEWQNYFSKLNINLQNAIIETYLILRYIQLDECNIPPELIGIIVPYIVLGWPKNDLHFQNVYKEQMVLSKLIKYFPN
eukprot:TRINITY_DN3733_c0_g1_i1.p1 TRINITY_DN3733_c0_g1~~TRINITY_DN3733_c0_g1_i1.p1  ORF type:complete len:320 (-),score=47.41 TRINITY_DN3733_c0_g1_i1:119-1078(-)